MKVDVFQMETFADTPEGAAILRHAFEHNAKNITQRLAPETTEDDDNGSFLLMLLDWKNSLIVRMVLDDDELKHLLSVLKNLNAMTVLDAFATEGMTVQ